MSSVHIEAFDLNLLTVFEALWAERNVTRAARRVGITQSAMSHALKRLRAQLSDALFHPTPGGMIPTPYAQELAGPLGEALALVRRTVETPRKFAPRTLRRTFTVATSDYVEMVLLPRLLARVARLAPEVTLVVRPAAARPERELVSGVHDLLITPGDGDAPGVRAQALFDERFVCVLRAGHPDAHGRKLSLERFLRLPHVLVSPQGSGPAAVDEALAALGKRRRVTLRIPNFLIAPLVIAETDHVITLPERVVRAVAGRRRLAVFPPPVALPGFSVSQRWHERNDADPAHGWFRDLVAEVAHAREA